MKVLFILPTLQPGGAENYALRFIRFCKEQEVDIAFGVLTPDLKKGELETAFKELGCQVYYLSIGYVSPGKFYNLYCFFKSERYDAIVTFNGNFGGIPLTLARLAGVYRRIAWHRRSTNAFGRNPLKLLYNRFVNHLLRLNATQIFSNSQFALDQFYGEYYQNDQRFKVIPNGVDPKYCDSSLPKQVARQKLGLPEGKFIIGHVGRFDPAKNHKTIFRVARKLKEKKLDVFFLFCGLGTDTPEFKQLLKDYGIADISEPYGLTYELPLIYRVMDVFYFPSLTEGQPSALIEAMVAGVPVLPSNIPPILEALPKKAKTIEATDVKSAVEQISKLIMEPILLDTFIYKQWAIGRFDYDKNFELFKKELEIWE